MNTILKIFILAYPLAIFIIPLIFYRKTRPCMMRFCRRMASERKCRRTYVLAIPVAALLYSFVFFKVKGPSLWDIPGLLAGLLLLREKFTSATLGWLHDDRVIQLLFFALVLFSMAMPELYTLSVTLATVLLASLFYPSRKVLKMMEHPDQHPEFHNTNDEIFRLYY